MHNNCEAVGFIKLPFKRILAQKEKGFAMLKLYSIDKNQKKLHKTPQKFPYCEISSVLKLSILFIFFSFYTLKAQTPYFEMDTKDTEWRIENQTFGESLHIGNDQTFPYLSFYGGGTPPNTAPNIILFQSAGNGYYYISSKERPNSYLEATDTLENSKIGYSSGASGDGKQWKFEMVNPKGFYRIVNKLSGKCLTTYYKARDPGDWDYYLKRLTFGHLFQNDYVNGKKEQLWNVEPIRIRAVNCIGISQLGWAPEAIKLAVLNKTNYINPPSFSVTKNGSTVLSGTTVFWGGRYYQNFYTMNLSSLKEPGEYQLSVDGEQATFIIADDAYLNMRHRYGLDTTHTIDFFDSNFGFITNWSRMSNWYTDYRQMEYKLPTEKVIWDYPYWQNVVPHSFDQDDLTYTSTGVHLDDSAMGIGWNHTDQQWCNFYPMSVTLHYLTELWHHNIEPAAKTKIEEEIAYGVSGFIGLQNADGSWPKATFISQKYTGTAAGMGMALAASVETLQDYDSTLAANAQTAAEKAWAYVEAHNNDSDWVPYDTQCYRWGFAETRMGLNVELYLLTGDTKYKNIAEDMINNAHFDGLGCWVNQDSPNTRFHGEETYITYSDEALYEIIRYYERANPNDSVKTNIERQMHETYTRWADDDDNNEGAFQEGVYYDYGGARHYLQRAIMLYKIYKILGDNYGKAYYLAEQKMDWVVGYNSFGTSLTYGVGDIYACPPFASGFCYGRVVPGIIEDPTDTSRLTISNASYDIGESDAAISPIYLLGNGLRYELRNSPPSTVSLFTSSSYSGAEIKLTGGRWTMQTIKSFGCDPLSVKSLKVSPGFRITIFDDDNFTGNSQEYYFNSSDLGSFNNRVKSVIIERFVPNANDDSLIAISGNSLIFDKPGILYNDDIPVNASVSILLTQDVSHGKLVLNEDGSLTYKPTAGFSGTDSFSYKLFDGKYSGRIATVNINVQANNSEINLGLNGTAFQSSTDVNNKGYAQNAIDGNTSGDYNDGSLSLTLALPKQWWTVDLGQACQISRVKLFNRKWPDGDDFTDFYIFVSKYPFTSDDPNTLSNDPNVSSFFHQGPFTVQNYAYLPEEMQINAVGRFVRVQLTTIEDITLDMAEVEVYGTYSAFSGNTPPAITALSPPNNSTFVVGSSVTFSASGTDFEDGDLDSSDFSWNSSIDGNFGTGTPLTATMSQGVHTITLTATDSGGATTSESFKLIIGDGFNPATIPGCTLWLDTNDIDGDWTPEGTGEDGVNGGAVTIWHDKSETGHNAEQADSAKQGTLTVNGLAGKPVLTFSQEGKYYTFPKISNIRTVFWVVKETQTGEHFLLGDDANYDFHRASGGALWSVYGAAVVRDGTTYLNGQQIDGVQTNLPANQAVLISLVTSGNATASRFSQDRTYTNRSWIGDVAEIIIYNQPLSVDNRKKVEEYLSYKWLGGPAPEYQLTVSNGSGSGQYAAGTQVTITANTPPTGQIFDKWSGDIAGVSDINSASTNLTMQAQNIYVSALYKAPPSNTYSISGTITGDIISGITVTAGNFSTVTDSSGKFSMNNLPEDTYTVIPTIDGYTFSPVSQNIILSGSNATGVDFSAVQNTAPMFTLTVNNGTGSGDYEQNASVTISASIPDGQIFDAWTGDTQYIADTSVADTTITMPALNITVTATFKPAPPDTYSVSGTITGDIKTGVTISIGTNYSAITDSSGNYTIDDLQDGSYTVTPSLSGYTFNPVNKDITINGSDITGIDFVSAVESATTYTLTVENGTGSGDYTENSQVQVTANVPAGQIFDAWTGDIQYLDDAGIASAEVTMPNKNIKITATFQQAPPDTFSVSGTVSGDITAGVTISIGTTHSAVTDSSGNYTISGLSNGSYAVKPSLSGYEFTPEDKNITISGSNITGIDFTAVSKPLEYQLTVVNGTGTGAYTENHTISITPNIPSGKIFDKWSGDTQYVADANSASTTVTMPAKNITVTANFKDAPPNTYSISGTISGDIKSGVSVAVDATHSATTDASGNYTISGLVDGAYTVTPTLTGYTFTPSTANATVTGADVTGINFTSTQNAAPKFTLTVNNGTGSGQYAENDSVTISATVPAGKIFDAWTGNTQYIADAGAASTTVTMPDKNITLTATFKDAPPNTYSISGSVTGDIANGVIITLNTGQSTTTNSSGNFTISGLTANTYTVTPSLDGYTFSPDSKSVTISNNDSTGVNFTATKDSIPEYTLTVNNGTGTGSYTQNTQVQISATVPTGKIFNNWTGDTQYVTNSNSASTTVTMPAKNITLTATFKDAPPNTYSISGSVTGDIANGVIITLNTGQSTTTNSSGNFTISGLTANTYTVTPSLDGYTFSPDSKSVTISNNDSTGVNFTATKDSIPEYTLTVNNGTGTGSYTQNTQVQISATVPTGKIFNNWTGDTQYVTNSNSASTTVTMPAKNITLTATFKDAPPNTYSIRGSVTGDIANGVIITLNTGQSTTTNSSGNFTISGLTNGSYTVTPKLTGYTFKPVNMNANIQNNDFVLPSAFISEKIPGGLYSISGSIKDSAGLGIQNVSLTLNNGTIVLSDTTGKYIFTGLTAGSYKIVPVLNGYTFTPLAQSVTLKDQNISNADFTGIQGIIPEVNNPPVAADDTYFAKIGIPLNANEVSGVLANDIDTDGDALEALVINSIPGLILQPNGGFTYTPQTAGNITFTYVATDGKLNSNTATVTITVLNSNEPLPPTAVGDNYTIPPGSEVLINAEKGVLSNDLNASGKTVDILPNGNPAHGKITLEPDGSFVYKSDPKYSGLDSFTYIINGTTPQSSAVVTLNIQTRSITLGSLLPYEAATIPALQKDALRKAPKLYGVFSNGKKGSLKKIKDSTASKFSGAWGKKYTLYNKKSLKSGYKAYYDHNGPDKPENITVMLKGKTVSKTKLDIALETVKLVPPVVTAIQNTKGENITETAAGSTIVLIGKYFGEKAPKVALEVNGKLLKCKIDKKGFKYSNYKGKQSPMKPYTGESYIKVILPTKKLGKGVYPIVLDNKIGIATIPSVSETEKGSLPIINIK